jgi:predicted nucleic acid-binding protein
VNTLLDTNILTRSSQEDHPQFAAASKSVELLRTSGDRLCVVPQNLYEFWAVATRPPSENGLGMTADQVQGRLARIKRLFVLLRDERGILAEWERLVGLHDVKGKPAHDARLVAAMRRHGLDRLLTFNASHFARFTEITVLSPDTVIAGNQ